ncbi:MAG: hypothetical protein C5B48_08835 [Candidatus Rokuibacteriota bacterium]|nr:MAG: hypothetical protein C5B48_08835 [Candidatus Rokubacteria bacterium]
MKVADVMTREVQTVSPEATLKEVAARLSELGISGLPVVDGDRVVGVVSEADVVAKERGEVSNRSGRFGLGSRRSRSQSKLEARTAGEAMTSPALTISADRPFAEAAARMLDEDVNRLPVLDPEDRLVGIVTRADLVRAFVRTDREIQCELLHQVIRRKLWVSAERVQVTVQDGDVAIAGHVDTRAEAELVSEFARKVPGVVSVSSSLTWDENGLE